MTTCNILLSLSFYDQLFCRTDDNTRPCLSVVDSKTFELKDSFHLDGKVIIKELNVT